MSKNLDETVRLQSEKREEWIQEIRGVVFPVWPAHQPRRSRGETNVRGTHCNLFEQEEREDSSCQIQKIEKLDDH